jgi:hypothetical protein
MSHEKDVGAEARREKYGQLPPPVDTEDTVISLEAQPAPDWDAERHIERTIGIGPSGTAM